MLFYTTKITDYYKQLSKNFIVRGCQEEIPSWWNGSL